MTDYTYPGNGPLYGLTLNAGDTATVDSGGAEAVTINDGGTLLAEGGTSYAIQVNSGGLVQVDAGHVDSLTLSPGGREIINGGQSNSAYVNGGTLTVNAGGTVSGADVANGGVEYLHGSNISSTVSTGGRIVLDQPGFVGDQPVPGSGTPNDLGSLNVNGGTLEIVNGTVDRGITLNGGAIAIDAIKYDGSITQTYDVSTGTLTVQGASGSYHLGVFLPPGQTGFALSADPVSGDVAVTAVSSPVCFRRGGMIATPDGAVPVETIRAGQSVSTLRGVPRPVRWVGRAVVDSATVVIRADALAQGVPDRDLRVTPGHSVLFGDVLIPIGELVNDRSIVREEETTDREVFHLELDSHDVLLANNAPVESFRDDGNRVFFRSCEGQARTTPERPCFPVVDAGTVVDEVWKRLRERAVGSPDMMTDDPDLHLVADGHRVEPQARDGDRFRFALPEAVGTLRLVSRHVVPADAGLARDRRRLGVALRRLSLDTDAGSRRLDYDAADLTQGFHEAEPDGRIRWTDGDAALTAIASLCRAPSVLTVELGCRTAYHAPT